MKQFLFSLICAALLGSCVTYKKCQEKFGTPQTDTVQVTVQVPVLVPRDSIITVTKTDTTYLYKEVQQGRARVIIERNPATTTVQAKCDTVTIIRDVPVKVPMKHYVFQDNPDKVSKFWKSAFWWMLAVNVLICLLFYITRKKE